MKKLAIVVAVLFLLPSVCLAGAVQSRWDMTIGGYVKGEIGYSDEGRAQGFAVAQRESKTSDNVNAEYGNFWAQGVQSRFGFRVTGPDAFGMKTSAFIETDFYSQSGTYAGALRMRYAYARFTGPAATITIGQQDALFAGAFGSGNLVGYGDALDLPPGRVPGIAVYYKLTKAFEFRFGAFANANPLGFSGTGMVNDFTRGGPHFNAELRFASDVCGKIGANMLSFTLDGTYGKEKKTYLVGTRYDDYNVDSWGLHAAFMIPIIPEKQGKKAGALGLSAYAYTGQNLGYFAPPYMAGNASYKKPAVNEWTANVLFAAGGQVWYYFTNEYSFNFAYGDVRQKMSNRFKAANPSAVERVKEWTANLCYDPNPALKFAIQWEGNKVTYAAETGGLSKKGKANTYRFAAFYYF